VDDAGRLLHHPGQVDGVRARLKDLFKAPLIAWQLGEQLGPAYYTSNWTRTQGSLFQAIKMEKTMMTLLLSFIVAVAAFNIISSQVMLVTEKRANIAVMRTLGATPGSIMRIFMVQGMLIGLAGTALGLLLGVFVSTHISEVGVWLQQNINPHLFDAYFVNYLPSRLEWSDVWHISALAILLTFLATLYPSWRASRVRPAEALRYE
jgi:lipoprotein-releasing system permease protein